MAIMTGCHRSSFDRFRDGHVPVMNPDTAASRNGFLFLAISIQALNNAGIQCPAGSCHSSRRYVHHSQYSHFRQEPGALANLAPPSTLSIPSSSTRVYAILNALHPLAILYPQHEQSGWSRNSRSVHALGGSKAVQILLLELQRG